MGNVYAAKVSFDLPELNISETQVDLTGNNGLTLYSPCDQVPASITCVEDSLNLEVTLTYPIEVTVTEMSVSQVLQMTLTATPEVSKEFTSFEMTENGLPATFPKVISSNTVINYIVTIKMDYMGFNSIPENASFFDIDITTN